MTYNLAEKRDMRGRWTSAFKVVAARLDALAHADGGPTRDKMPQLSGVPEPGSKADKMFPHRAPGSEVDLTEQFQRWLPKHGVKVIDTEVPSSVLHPSQDELNEAKVVGIAKFMEKAPKDSPVFEPIFTTADNHIIDGHHRWAANETRNEVDGVPRWMKVRQMQAPLDKSLALATQFMDEYGLPRVGVSQGSAVVSAFANTRSLSRVHLRGSIDLSAHDVSHELRGHGGEWVKSPDSAAKRIAAKASVQKITLGGKTVSLDEAVKQVSAVYEWGERDKEGGGRKADIIEQDKAQIVAKNWITNITGDSPADLQYAASLWEQYQNPGLYGTINSTLRTGHAVAGGPSPATLKKYVSLMFDKGGYTTSKPITLFRALKSGPKDWSKTLTPGTVFTDKGIVSTTAHKKFSAGWLLGDSQGASTRTEQPNDVVLEIQVPTGQRVVGGDPQFVETMLPPGTRLKVKSSETVTGPAQSPIDPNAHTKLTYTHVVAEVIP